MKLSLGIQLAHLFIQHTLQALDYTHLGVRIQECKLIIYSIDRHEETHRAILMPFVGNEFMLTIANPRGGWQFIPHAGSLAERMSELTGKLAFALARWQ